MSSVHKVRTNHGEDDGEAVLSRKLHALFELMLEQACVETEIKEKKMLYSQFIQLLNNFLNLNALRFSSCIRLKHHSSISVCLLPSGVQQSIT